MPTDHQISILVDVASKGGAGLPKERLSGLLDLVSAGLVEAEHEGIPDRYKLTAKGQRVLDDRGVGANES